MSFDLKNIVTAIEEAKKLAKPRRFKQSVELIVKLREWDVKKPENRFTLTIRLPHPPPDKLARVGVFASGDLLLKAKEAGADAVFSRDDIQKLADKRAARKVAKQYDFFVAQADLMPLIGRFLGRYLGPRGKMPQPVPPNVNIEGLLNNLRASVRVRIKDQPQVMCRVGSEDQDPNDIAENIIAVLNALSSKIRVPQNIERVYVKLTMGPAVEVRLK